MEIVNEIRFSGVLQDDVRFIKSKKGNDIGKLRLLQERFYQYNGENRSEKTYMNVTAFGNVVEQVRDLTKGIGVLVEGRIQNESWEAKDGSGTKYDKSIIASYVEVLGDPVDEPDMDEVPF